jgi:hypothetical protein
MNRINIRCLLQLSLIFVATLLAHSGRARAVRIGHRLRPHPKRPRHSATQQGEQELQQWATELQNWEQHLQKEEQIYTTAYQTMNQVIAAYNLAYQMSRMPQNLAARYKADFAQWTNLTNPSLAASNTSGITFGVAECAQSSAIRRAPRPLTAARSIQVQSYPSGRLSSLDATTQATVQNQYASSEIGQSNVTNLLSTLGTIRSDSQAFQQKLRTSNRTPIRPIPTYRPEVGVLAKINAATLLANPLAAGHQPDPCRAAAQQQALDAKEKLDERNRLINQSIYFQQNFPTTMQNVNNGVSDSMPCISLSLSGSN